MCSLALCRSKPCRVQACTRTIDPFTGWPKASDEHVLNQTALTPSFARGSRLQTTPKGRKAKAPCKGRQVSPNAQAVL